MRRAIAVVACVLACDKAAPNPSVSARPSVGASVGVAPSVGAGPTVSARRDAKPPASVAVQHVLVAYKGAKNAPKGIVRRKADAKKRAEEVRDKARAGADFTELVKSYSDDPGASERMGSLGKITRDKVVPEFADAAFALEVDRVSDVVETPFGFHVIKRNQ